MQSLIQRLDAAYKNNPDPDQIARLLGDPFPDWRLGITLTRPEYEQYKDVKIVLLATSWHNRPNLAESNSHKLGVSNCGHRWLMSHWRDWLGRGYFFRSQASYDANPDEPAPALGPSVDDDD